MPSSLICPFSPSESGERIIELSFSPTDHAGFVPFNVKNATVYEVQPTAQAEYFTVTSGADRFNFFHLAISDENNHPTGDFDFHGYFGELIDEHLAASPTPSAVTRSSVAMKSRALESSQIPRPGRAQAYSLKIGSLLDSKVEPKVGEGR